MRIGLIVGVAVTVMFASRSSFGEGVTVGSKAPKFTLQDQNGKQRSIDELLKDRNVALVFHRSADW